MLPNNASRVEEFMIGRMRRGDPAVILQLAATLEGEEGFARRNYARRQRMFSPYDSEDVVFIVISGRVRIYLANEDKELTISILRPGDVYSTHTRAYVQSFKESAILAAPAQRFRQELTRHPELLGVMFGVLGDLLGKAYNHIDNLAFKSVQRRLREFLALEARRHGEAEGEWVTLSMDLTVEELAGVLGATRQTVSTALNELARVGWMEHLGRGVIEHVDALLVVAEPGLRSLQTAAQAARMGKELGIVNQLLILNRCADPDAMPQLPDLPAHRLGLPYLPGLAERQLTDGSVLGLPEQAQIDGFCMQLVEALG